MASVANPAERIRVVVADDHAVVRAGLRSLLQSQRDMMVVGEASDSKELLACVRAVQPDVIVTDLRMPGGGVLETIAAARRETQTIGIVVFSAFDDSVEAALALRAGASGYVLKQAPEARLLDAIRGARLGRRFVDEPLASRVAEDLLHDERDAPGAFHLSARENAVLDLIARGYTGPEIATALGVRVGTVEAYRHRIRKKLGVKSRAEITEFARSTRRRFPERP